MDFSLTALWSSMGIIAKSVAICLLLFSIYSIGVGIERLMVFAKAKKESRMLLKIISELWKEGKIEESIQVSADRRFKNSHLAKVLVAGLNELQFQEDTQASYEDKVESAKRANMFSIAIPSIKETPFPEIFYKADSKKSN